MASSSFELDDQTDEDFFDKLVNEDLDFGGSSKPIGVVETSEVVLANAVENLSISAVEKQERVDSVSEDSFGFGDGLGEKTNLESLNSPAVAAESKVSELESESGRVKVVQWDSFTSDSTNLRGSYSDLFGGFGESSNDPFANVGGGENSVVQAIVENVALEESFVGALGSSSHEKPREDQQNYGNSVDLNSSQHWENAYPGWKYDSSTGQWYQIVDNNANVNSNGDLNSSANYQGSSNFISSTASTQISDRNYSEQTAANNAVATGNVSDWNQVSQGSTEYPSNMVFDQQYPGFYFDTISMEWKSLESYKPAVDYSRSVDGGQQYANKTDQYYPTQSNATQQESVTKWDGSHGGYDQQNASVWQTQQTVQSVTVGYNNGIQQSGIQYSVKDHGNNSVSHQQQMGSSQVFGGGFGVSSGVQNVNSQGNFSQFHGQVQEVKPQEAHFSAAPFNNGHNMALYSSQPMQSQSSCGFSYVGAGEERTSAKRPPHALVTFGFGGKLVVMKDTTSSFSSSVYGSQDTQGAGGVINVYNLMEVVTEKSDASSLGSGGRDYFGALCHQSFPGPLVGGNPGSKELNKWIDDKIASYETAYMDVAKRDLLRMLFSLLKIAVQYYGKLRSPFGSDQALKENDSPDAAVAKLFASAKMSQEYGNFTQCLQNIPSEAQIQATALEVQKLLVSGKKKEALEFAQEGQLWGPALVLASQLGDQPYGDTVKKMALNQLLPGSPLRTLCLLIAGQPADVFSKTAIQSSVPGSLNTFQQPAQVQHNSFLDEWTQNLAIISANRTKDDELVIVHLGDNLWKETGEITAAHICYLVAEANLEQYSDSARLCLIGADHWKSPRTYASPEAIQRTELYEYSKVLGNSQFSLLPFQPYKLVYAYMLAEVGKVSVALKYCQAILKSLKTGRSPEVEAWRQLVSSLEDRIKTHQQGGYGTNLAQGGTKLVGKLLSIFDSTAHRVVGAMPPPIPSIAQSNTQQTDHAPPLGIPRISNSQSALSSPFLMPSSSTENDNITIPNRSISEPDFSRSPRKVDSNKKEDSSTAQEKTTAPGSSRFGRLFGSKLLQKTVGLVIRQRPDNEAKLGLEEMTFYYDENLKRWVERGVTPAAEQEPLAPPPTSAAFQSGTQDYNSFQSTPQPDRFNTGPEIRNSSPPEGSPGIPPVPPSSNQFSARGRSMVGRPRYVDTFNRSGPVATKTFHLPPTQAAKPVGGANFFVPAAVTSSEQTGSESFQEGTMTSNGSSSSLKDDANSPVTQFPTTPAPASAPAMQRFPSMDTIASRSEDMGRGGNYGSIPSNSRRTASWSGGLNKARDNNPSSTYEIRPLGEALGIPPQMYMAGNSTQHLRRNSGSFGDDLHEVQL